MGMLIAERRQIENEMIFRRANEKVGDGLDVIDAMHIEDDNPELIRDAKLVLHFKCECSDESCDERIALIVNLYQKIHTDRDTFIVKPNHQVDAIEKVITATPDYCVVKKNNSTAEPSNDLNITSIDNSAV